jgi:hypothetical protein
LRNEEEYGRTMFELILQKLVYDVKRRKVEYNDELTISIRVLEKLIMLSYSRNSLPCMKPEVSLLR